MSWLLGLLAGCVVSVFVVAARWLGRAHAEPRPPAGAAPEALSARRFRPLRWPRGPQGETHAGRCVLCQAPLPSHFVTREEVIARVEHLIDADTDAVARLLAAAPHGTWAPRPIRP